MAQQTINIGTSANDGTGDPLRTAFDKANDNFNEIYAADFVTQARIADDVIDYARMGTEFTTSAVISASDVDFSTAQVFTKTLTANTTLTFSNASVGMVKDLIITGNFTLTLPAGSTVTGTYDGTVSNLIQVVVTGASTYWYSISQPQ
jgi:hypothetical protein